VSWLYALLALGLVTGFLWSSHLHRRERAEANRQKLRELAEVARAVRADEIAPEEATARRDEIRRRP